MAKVNLTPDEPAPVIPQVPPVAKLPAGFTGHIPIKPGKPITILDPRGMGADEIKQLKAVGWQEGQPVPSNMAEIIREVSEEMHREANTDVLPVDPSTPPSKLKTVMIADLPPDQQAKVKKKMEESLAAFDRQQQMRRQAASGVLKRIEKVPDGEAVEIPLDEPQPQAGPLRVEKAVEADADDINPKARKTAPAPVVAVEPEAEKPEAAAPLTHCRHCGWDLSITDIPEPASEVRAMFLASIMGQKPFMQEFKLMGGKLLLTLRVLTTMENDAIFRQAYRERDAGVIPTLADQIERINRLRMYLQIYRMRTSDVTFFDKEMPDGLSKATNPNAKEFWTLPENDPEPLLKIEKFIMKEVLTNEAVSRIVQRQCTAFNRLVDKLEGMIDSPDFWQATA